MIGHAEEIHHFRNVLFIMIERAICGASVRINSAEEAILRCGTHRPW